MQKLTYIGMSDYDYPAYKDEQDRIWFDTNYGDGEPDLYRSSNGMEGEPDYSINFEYELINQFKRDPKEFHYMMLSRLSGDCKAYLSDGGDWRRGREDRLWSTKENIIAEMKKLWNELIVKPEWLTMEQILDYENKMLNGG
jgi:hypothetical protein